MARVMGVQWGEQREIGEAGREIVDGGLRVVHGRRGGCGAGERGGWVRMKGRHGWGL